MSFLIESIRAHYGFIAEAFTIYDIIILSVLSVFALTYFVWLALVEPFAPETTINPFSLFIDTVVSMILMIFVFALWYRIFGLKPHSDTVQALDTVYFSAVTFSTLGFGDFSPKPQSQVFAAVQAILGNLHLGVIVGSIFTAIQRSKNSVK